MSQAQVTAVDLGKMDGGARDKTEGRQLLPVNVVPTHYHVTLEPDLEKFTYEGRVAIDLDVKADSSSISLHAVSLDIKDANISTNGQVIALTTSIDEHTQVAKFDFNSILAQGSKVQLNIRFTGQLNNDMFGFYRSTFKRSDGSEGVLATSHMEPTACRRAFPCFDEPALKAVFVITLVADKHLTCLSNMDVASETVVPSSDGGIDKKAVTFNPSPVMSTYLVAFIVGELDYIETRAFRVPIRVYAPPGQDIQHGKFALNLAAKTLEYYEKIFGIEYPLPKMDQVAIPDFAIGAMENWGLVTYRTIYLLLDESVSGANAKMNVAECVQHELAHQWFGNLVTMDWWEGLWLKEGFATWISWHSSSVFYPEWKVWEAYVTDNLQSALSLDSLRSSHPIEVPVKQADEINQIFDDISYSKGSCVVRMVSAYLGEAHFLEGVRLYLKKHAYGNATTGDLWAALDAVSGKPVSEMMNTWTKKIGHPMISVFENQGSIIVKQNRFLRTGDVRPEEDEVIYPVLLGLRTKTGVDSEMTLVERQREIKLHDDDFFKLNANHTGIYRTLYPPKRLQKLGRAAQEDGLLSTEDRIGIIADAGALATSGYQKTSGLLDLLQGFRHETQFAVWKEIITRLRAIQGAWVFEDLAVVNGLEAFQRDLISSKTHAMGWHFSDSDSHVEQQFKSILFESAGLAGDQKVIAAAQEMFTKFMGGDASAVPPNIRRSVFAIVLKNGGKEDYNQILNLYQTSTNGDEKSTALGSLGYANDPLLIKRTLNLLFSPDVKNQDVYKPILNLRTHCEGIKALYEWMEGEWDTIYTQLQSSGQLLGHVVAICTSAFTSKEQLDRIDEFFSSKNNKGYDHSLAQSRDGIQSRSAWLQRDRADVAAWVKENGYTLA